MVEESSIIVSVLFASECSSTFELMYAPPAKAMSIGIGAQHTQWLAKNGLASTKSKEQVVVTSAP